MMKYLLTSVLLGLFGGCKYAGVDEPIMSEDLAAYLELCRNTALIGDDENECKENWWVESSAMTWSTVRCHLSFSKDKDRSTQARSSTFILVCTCCGQAFRKSDCKRHIYTP